MHPERVLCLFPEPPATLPQSMRHASTRARTHARHLHLASLRSRRRVSPTPFRHHAHALLGPAETRTGMLVPPTATTFSGLVFKLQANMDPKHRLGLARADPDHAFLRGPPHGS